jgi:STAM-binding protein
VSPSWRLLRPRDPQLLKHFDMTCCRFGIFRLTEPAGLMTVLQCKRRQTFHEHPRIPGGLYTDADHGGHVLLNERGRRIEVIDLRR